LALAVGLGVVGARVEQLSHHAPPPTTAQADLQVGRRFGWITAIEGAAIFLVVVLLNATGRPDFILPVIALIVGLHFFPLARLFGASIYYVTGLLGCVIGVAGLLIADPALRHSVVGLSFGLLLWLTAAALLVQAVTLSIALA